MQFGFMLFDIGASYLYEVRDYMGLRSYDVDPLKIGTKVDYSKIRL